MPDERQNGAISKKRNVCSCSAEMAMSAEKKRRRKKYQNKISRRETRQYLHWSAYKSIVVLRSFVSLTGILVIFHILFYLVVLMKNHENKRRISNIQKTPSYFLHQSTLSAFIDQTICRELYVYSIMEALGIRFFSLFQLLLFLSISMWMYLMFFLHFHSLLHLFAPRYISSPPPPTSPHASLSFMLCSLTRRPTL